MLFLNYNFTASKRSLEPTPTKLYSITIFKLKNGIYDDIYATQGVLNPWNGSIPEEWDFDTLLYGMFQGNLYGGNVNFTSKTVTSIRVKKRKKNTFKWSTINEIPIHSDDDFNFERNDFFNRAETDYEYAFVPTLNGIEGNYNINTIRSAFDGIYLVEKDIMYHSDINAELSMQLNRDTNSITTLGKKYPFYISNGNSSYYSFDMNASFIEEDDNCELDLDNGWKFREIVDHFLSNNRPKILKTDEGKMWMVSVIDNIGQDNGQHSRMPVHSIRMVEIGDPESPADLYDNNFTEIDLDVVRR